MKQHLPQHLPQHEATFATSNRFPQVSQVLNLAELHRPRLEGRAVDLRLAAVLVEPHPFQAEVLRQQQGLSGAQATRDAMDVTNQEPSRTRNSLVHQQPGGYSYQMLSAVAISIRLQAIGRVQY